MVMEKKIKSKIRNYFFLLHTRHSLFIFMLSRHVQEHMKAIVKDESGNEKVETPELSEQDMIYYLFVIHDLNGDGYLDGHELRAAFTDFDEDSDHHDHQGTLRKKETIPMDEITDMVDHVLEEDDTNGE